MSLELPEVIMDVHREVRDVSKTATAQFQQDLVDGCHELKKLGYWPGYFYREIAREGGVPTVKRLLSAPGASEGFARLWELGRLDMAVETFVLLPWYEDLFTAEERRVARGRLEAHGFKVDAFLGSLRAAPPWYSVSEPRA